MKKPVYFTRSLRNQIVTSDLVFTLFCGMEQNDLSPQSMMCIRGIQGRIQKIQESLYGGVHLVLAPKDHRKYMRIIKGLKRLINTAYGEKVPLDFYNAVMMKVADVLDEIETVKDRKYVGDWRRVLEMMETIYGHMEGLAEHNDYITTGIETRKKIEWIMEAA